MAEHIRMSPDGKSMVFSANAGSDALDIDRRHAVRDAERCGNVDHFGIELRVGIVVDRGRQAGRMALQCCGGCRRLRYPVAPACPYCFGESFEWQPVSGRAELLAWARRRSLAWVSSTDGGITVRDRLSNPFPGGLLSAHFGLAAPFVAYTIAGGIADDLIIHGSTRYDANTTALDALLAEWSRTTATYALRVSHLRTGIGGLNGANKLTGAITDDIATDTMAGAGGQDWFFARVTAPAAGRALVAPIRSSPPLMVVPPV